MTTFLSNHPRYSVYIKGKLIHFSNGQYKTDDKKLIEELKKIRDLVYIAPLEQKAEPVIEQDEKPKTKKQEKK